ncbi:MAG: selenide, water dikinase SelD [Magnetococcales bacterium]|nr:selenide, water dikinase SelD [Magnetococcales bacterium]
METIKLTAFSTGGGCGCKISPKDLQLILDSSTFHPLATDDKLLVGNDSNDDAAVYDLGNGNALVSTTDFFTPIVNDPSLFGKIASVNAISDVYAMGGQPLVAIAILGWPLKKLSADIAKQVISGARTVCQQAGISLAGGHSIDISEPIFGLAVTGQVKISHLKRNNTAKPGAQLFLTKPLGVGILTTAEKKAILKPEHTGVAIDSMTRLNNIGYRFAQLDGVQAMTDVTGFGLLGHLYEMCVGSDIHAVLDRAKIPVIDGLKDYIDAGAFPGGTNRNWSSYGHRVRGVDDTSKAILCDPQTSGGLLVAVAPEHINTFLSTAKEDGLFLQPFGEILDKKASGSESMIMVE